MIRFADETTRQQVREMWKTVFGDPDDYMRIYFRRKYRDENTLLYIEGEKVVASLQMLPYRFTFCGTEIPVIYLSGVSTLPEYRKRGYVRQLLVRSFEEAARRGVPLMLLVPQEEWLLGFYERYGFAQTFDAGGSELLSLKELIVKHPGDLYAAFREFDALFRQKEMTVQKSFDDFRAIVEEAALYDFPPVRNLTGMARIIDAGKLLSLHGQRAFSIRVRDELIGNNNALFPALATAGTPLEADVRELAQLLLGYHTSKKPEPFNTLFPEKQPQMHFMLE
jgi:predicted acetyltransferase